MRFNDLVFAFPALLSAVMITAVFGPGAINAIIAIGIFNIPVFARVARAAALSLWSREFVMAAGAIGKSPARITRRSHFAELAILLIVQATIQFSLGILAEAGLSYVGLGFTTSDAELGSNAVRSPDNDWLGPAHGAVSRSRHRHHRSRVQLAWRWFARCP